MGKVKHPSMSMKLVKNTISKMTGLDYDIVHMVLDAYAELMYKTVLSGIEFPLKKVGVIGFSEIPPKPEGMYHNAFLKKKVFYPARPGYLKVLFRTSSRMKDKLKASTLFGEGICGDEYKNFIETLYQGKWGRPFPSWDNANLSQFDKEHEEVRDFEDA